GPVISVTTIVDLTAKDTIDISQLDADTLTSGNQAFHLVDAFTGQAGELLVKYHAGADTTFIQGDVDGDGVADVTIKVWGDHADFSGFVL
ncbi:MAG: M10 family metallopeptidase C-terminal domain-containing protein, partial [Caulobacteraceae bacterium]